MKARTVLAVAAAVLAVGGLALQSTAQVKRGKTRPMTTKQLMSGLVKPQCTALGDALKGDGPADEKAWTELATRAALVNESGYAMMEDGRCPDAVWANACKMLQDGSASLMTKAEARDLTGARESLGRVMKSCGACHTTHKK